MEEKTSFDLNSAIQRWKAELARSPEFCKQDLDELECHLDDSVGELQTRGLSAEEAFIIATRRIGPRSVLATEFSRVNNPAIWADRLLWAVLGFVFVGVVRSIYALPLILFVPIDLPGFLPAIIWSLPVIAAGLVVLSAVRTNGYVSRLMSKLLRRPAVLSLWVILVGLAPNGLMALGMNKYMFFGAGRAVYLETLAGSSVWLVIMALFVFVLARRRLQLART